MINWPNELEDAILSVILERDEGMWGKCVFCRNGFQDYDGKIDNRRPNHAVHRTHIEKDGWTTVYGHKRDCIVLRIDAWRVRLAATSCEKCRTVASYSNPNRCVTHFQEDFSADIVPMLGPRRKRLSHVEEGLLE